MSDTPHDVFTRVTQKIVADLEKGVRPWQKPWNGENAATRIMRPLRHNGEPYNGVNVLLLWDAAIERGYQSPVWMTFNQAQEYGASVRKGEKSSFVVYANKVTKVETDKETGADIERQIPFMRGYNVFNIEQIDGLPVQFAGTPQSFDESTKLSRCANVDHFIHNTGAVIKHGGDRAYYSPTYDYIQMPHLDAFRDTESYYATLTHEATHWTRHETRLDRDFGRTKWGDEGYAREELVAEIGAAFLCADLGISPETREDHAAYIENWLRVLKDDKKFIFTAAAHATRAIEFLKSKQPSFAPTVQPELLAGIPDFSLLYTSEPMKIGKHDWRILIERMGRGVATRYEFLDNSGMFWRRGREWKDYDINDTYLGLPKNLSKLFERERPALIKHGVVPPPAPSKQLEFTL